MEEQELTPQEDFKVIDRNEGYIKYIGAGGDVVVPPTIDGCVVRKLSCPDCGITNINIIHNPELTYLDCTDNPLKTFDRSHNPNLTELHLEATRNKLTHLDLTNIPDWQKKLTILPELQEFSPQEDFEVIDRNEGYIKYIGAGGDVVVPPTIDGCVVRKLSCPDCGITNINIIHNPELTYLDCTDNPLKTFDRSHNPNLTELHLEATRNKLTHLDLTNIPELRNLFCDTNKLTHLDVSSAKKPSFASAKAAAVGARDASVKELGTVKRHEQER